MSFSGYKLYGIYLEYKTGNELYDNFADQFVKIEANEEENELREKLDPKSPNSNDNKDNIVEDDINIEIDFETLLAANKDIIGWIYSTDTPINYPIVQSQDNDYYLRRMIDGAYNTAGSIFMDYRNNKDLTDLNTIIYGHNMKNNSMFGTLDQYKSQDYYDEHPIMYLITPDQTYKLELIAGLVVNDTSEVYKIPQKEDELESLYKEMVKKSTFKTNLSLEEGDRLITLSTCSYENDSARYLIVGKISD